jgi:hypothetical protein
MKIILKQLLSNLYKFGATELLVVFCFIFSLNNFIGNAEITIRADGEGYYDYLVSTFISDDLSRKDLELNDPIYNRLNSKGYYVEFEDRKVNKYPVGTALLISPFFLSTYISNNREIVSGYEPIFQRSVFRAAIFYLFFGLLFFRLLAECFSIDKLVIFASQFFMVMATSITYYANFDASYSHIYSLFTIGGFLYFTKRYFIQLKTSPFLLACLFLGFTVLIRQVNVLVLLFLPFIAGSWSGFKIGMIHLFKPYWRFIIGFFIVFFVCIFQCYFWYQQTGHFLVYSYGGEVFFFWDPNMFKVLFSYNRGLFIWAPILFVSIFGLARLIYQKKYFLTISWLFAFLVFVYIISCWWVWTYGATFGHRVFIEYYPLFFLLFGLLLTNRHKAIQLGVITILSPLIYVNAVQVYQYSNYILDWKGMNKEKYWNIFLETDDKFKGIFFQDPANIDELDIVKKIDIGDRILVDDVDLLVYSDSGSILSNRVDFIALKFDADFDKNSESVITIVMDDLTDDKNLFWAQKPFVHFVKGDFHTIHNGHYNFLAEFPKTDHVMKFSVLVKGDQHFREYKNMELLILKRKW